LIDLSVYRDIFNANRATNKWVIPTRTFLFKSIADVVGNDCVVELGTFHGDTAAILAGIFDRVYTVTKNDVDTPVWGVETVIAREKLKDKKNVEIVIADSIELGSSWHGHVNVVFCDSNHGYEHVLGELETWNKVGVDVFVVDDMIDISGWHGDPWRAVIDYCAANDKKYVMSVCGPGIGIIDNR